MPDDDRTKDELKMLAAKGARQDWIDRRDLFYSPSLATLKARYLPSPHLFGTDDPTTFAFGLRNQGANGRCAGYALANLVDIQRSLQSPVAIPRNDQVSADMLYHLARFHDQYTSNNETPLRMSHDADGVRSLRSVIKAFYHHGVCLDMPEGVGSEADAPDCRWMSRCYFEANGKDPKEGGEQDFPEVKQAKAARKIGLGAYFRLRPNLNHYHAALNDAGAILVSANLTMGWHKDNLERGIIPFGDQFSLIDSTHAIVLVGYDERGFLVLNSWGPDWGGYQTDDDDPSTSLPGIGLWRYDDWAQNVVDGWVLRLGVSAPDAFDLTIGEQGTSRIYGMTRAGSVPCQELLGHFVHLDDGHHVELGAYPSNERIVKKTLDFLAERLSLTPLPKGEDGNEPRRYKGVALWICGSLEDMEEGFAASVRRKRWFQQNDLFPISVFWCNDFVEHSMEVLADIFAKSVELAGEDAKHLDQVIENRARGIGRAFWRDIETGARRVVDGITHLPDHHIGPAPPGHVQTLLKELIEQARTRGTALHLVAEGAGALVLSEWLDHDDRVQGGHIKSVPGDDLRVTRIAEKSRHITSVQLAMPAIDINRARGGLLDFVQSINARQGKMDPVKLTLGESGKDAQSSPVALRLSRWEARKITPPPARIYVPDKDLESRVTMAPYGKSILHLVANAFEDRQDLKRNTAPQVMLGMACSLCEIARNGNARIDRCKGPGCNCAVPYQAGIDDALKAAFSKLKVKRDTAMAFEAVDQKALSKNTTLEAEILATIQYHTTRKPAAAKKKRTTRV